MIAHRHRIEVNDDPRSEGKYSGIETRLFRPNREITINGYHIEEFCDDAGAPVFVLVNGVRVRESYIDAIRMIVAKFKK